MSRKQRRYKNVFDVDVDILKHKRTANQLEVDAEAANKEMKNARLKSEDPKMTNGESQYWREQSLWYQGNEVKIRKKISSIFEMQIPRLVRTRAALLTQPMPFLEGDKSVTLQHDK